MFCFRNKLVLTCRKFLVIYLHISNWLEFHISFLALEQQLSELIPCSKGFPCSSTDRLQEPSPHTFHLLSHHFLHNVFMQLLRSYSDHSWSILLFFVAMKMKSRGDAESLLFLTYRLRRDVWLWCKGLALHHPQLRADLMWAIIPSRERVDQPVFHCT